MADTPNIAEPGNPKGDPQEPSWSDKLKGTEVFSSSLPMPRSLKTAWILTVLTIASTCVWLAAFAWPKLFDSEAVFFAGATLILFGVLCSIVGMIYALYGFFFHRFTGAFIFFLVNLAGFLVNIACGLIGAGQAVHAMM